MKTWACTDFRHFIEKSTYTESEECLYRFGDVWRHCCVIGQAEIRGRLVDFSNILPGCKGGTEVQHTIRSTAYLQVIEGMKVTNKGPC